MFKTDDVVFFEDFGICTITAIEERPYNGIMHTYYVLAPISDSKSLHTSISVSVDTNKMLREIASKDEIRNLLQELPHFEHTWNSSSRKRENYYKECIKNGNLCDFAHVISYIYNEKIIYHKKGKPFPTRDLNYLIKARELFTQEVAYVLDRRPEEVDRYVRELLCQPCGEADN